MIKLNVGVKELENQEGHGWGSRRGAKVKSNLRMPSLAKQFAFPNVSCIVSPMCFAYNSNLKLLCGWRAVLMLVIGVPLCPCSYASSTAPRGL
jgi:hypothetical protein